MVPKGRGKPPLNPLKTSIMTAKNNARFDANINTHKIDECSQAAIIRRNGTSRRNYHKMEYKNHKFNEVEQNEKKKSQL